MQEGQSMRRRSMWVIAVLLGCFVVGFAVESARSEAGCQSRACERRVAEKERAVRESCRSRACKRRVCTSLDCRSRVRLKAVRRHWRETVAGFEAANPGLLAARRYCESNGSGGYRANTGNGFFGAYQFSARSWADAGGVGLPHNASPLEQDYRAVIWQPIHGGDPWPECP